MIALVAEATRPQTRGMVFATGCRIPDTVGRGRPPAGCGTRCSSRGGADALELNFYHVATDMLEDAASVERRVVDIVAVLKESTTIPLAVKLSPFYSALPHLASQLDRIGADGVVLFNRFYQPDIDPERGAPAARDWAAH